MKAAGVLCTKRIFVSKKKRPVTQNLAILETAIMGCYNPKTHEFQEPDYLNMKELPKDLIAVRFPSERSLDRIGWNRKYGFYITHVLVKNGLKLQFAAKNIP